MAQHAHLLVSLLLFMELCISLSGRAPSAFPKRREKDVKALEDTLSVDIPTLVKQVQKPHSPWK